MSPQPAPRTAEQALRSRPDADAAIARRRWFWGVAVGALVVGVGVLGIKGGIPALLQPSADAVSQQQVDLRARDFAGIGRVELREVQEADIPRALAGMNLTAPQQAALIADLQRQETDQVAGLVTRSQEALTAAAPQPTPRADAPASGAARKSALPLAWVTLWDTDVQDGDVVRITSDGYSRDVTIARTPVTFAVPIPRSGVINVTGIFDGGGGITVGMTSKGSPVALPVMSVGQVLGVPVVVR